MTLNPPPEQQVIDRSRGAVLPVALFMLGDLLRLPAGQEVTAIRIRDNDTAEFLVEGAGLPERKPDCDPQLLSLLFRMEFREGAGGREKRVLAHWEHAPNSEWLVRNWESS